MADPQTAQLSQLRNIQVKTGQTIPALLAAVAGSGLARTGERRQWLMEHFGLGYGDANAVAYFANHPLPPGLEASSGAGPAAGAAAAPTPADTLALLYSGNKSALRPLHDAVMALLQGWGDFEQAPKKTYISLRRKKQFAMVGPATQTQIEIGLNAKDLPVHPRLKLLPPGGMCQGSTRISHLNEVDDTLRAWLRQAFDAAG